MSEQATEKAQQVTSTARAGSRLWHAAADDGERAKAMAGESFRTRCGLTSGRSAAGQRIPRKARQLAPMEPCVVCCLTPPGASS